MHTASQVMEMVHTSENSGVEFKEVRIVGKRVEEPHRDSLSDELAAFANQSGGTVIFGVADHTRQITGITTSNISTLVSYISEICHDSVDPPLVDFYVGDVLVKDEFGDERYLVYVQVEKSLWLHKSSNGYFYRHGNSKREMTTEHLLRVGQSRSQVRIISFDEQAVPNTNQDNLQKDLYMQFIANDNQSSLTQRRLLTTHNDSLHATVSGILMCNPVPDQYIQNSYIQAVFYRGKHRDANYQIDAKDCRGPLNEQIICAYNFVSQYNRLSAIKEVGREEKPQYSMRAVFEALVNAIVHRDYSIYGSKIRLFMFSDRLEIHSPGALANTLTVENLADNQFTRNELLSRLLSELSLNDGLGQTVRRRYFLERRGEGVGIILRESENLSGRRPVYHVADGQLKLTIHAAESLQGTTDNIPNCNNG
ncbi:MAG: putative DNA binding domain-containing protein [Gammaproteobacteria bacterium]|nr:putative DNA binding domain-containing protein [Gammaproteobacteria bacterium]